APQKRPKAPLTLAVPGVAAPGWRGSARWGGTRPLAAPQLSVAACGARPLPALWDHANRPMLVWAWVGDERSRRPPTQRDGRSRAGTIGRSRAGRGAKVRQKDHRAGLRL